MRAASVCGILACVIAMGVVHNNMRHLTCVHVAIMWPSGDVQNAYNETEHPFKLHLGFPELSSDKVCYDVVHLYKWQRFNFASLSDYDHVVFIESMLRSNFHRNPFGSGPYETFKKGVNIALMHATCKNMQDIKSESRDEWDVAACEKNVAAYNADTFIRGYADRESVEIANVFYQFT